MVALSVGAALPGHLTPLAVARGTDLRIGPDGAPNDIERENARPGHAGWRIGAGSFQIASDAAGQVKGYASASSVAPGGTIDLHVSVNPAQPYTIDVLRMGWYDGAGSRLVAEIGPLAGTPQPACPVEPEIGLIACDWAVGHRLTIAGDWTSGVYLAVLTNQQGFQNYVLFVVRAARPATFLFVVSDTTYQAYNNYPDDGVNGKSLYASGSVGAVTIGGSPAAVKVSFDRPYAGDGSGRFFREDFDFLRWVERSGYDVAYATDVDIHARPKLLEGYGALLFAGHDEYWTMEMFDRVASARDAGVHLAFFQANNAYAQIRLEPSARGVPHRTIVCYRRAELDPVQGPTTTVRFRDHPVNRPEQTLIGVMYTNVINAPEGVPYVVAGSSHWVYEGTGLVDGEAIPALVGGEGDRLLTELPMPESLSYTTLSNSPYPDWYGGTDAAQSAIYQAPSGAWVFAAGSFRWSRALDREGFVDPRIQRATSNILARFRASPPAAPVARALVKGAAPPHPALPHR